MEVNPLATDFAALRTLRLVFDHGSFSVAAEVLDVNQSNVSYTIDRLRKAFRDPLFVRQGGGIAATDRCREIVDVSVQILEQFESIADPVVFDPSTTKETFTIACNYYERQTIIPLLVRELRRRAPGVALELVMSSAKGTAMLKRAEADMLIGPIRPDENGLFCRRLMSEHYVCVMDRSNPLSSGELSLEAYVGANHAVVTYGGNWRSGYLTQLDAQGLQLNRTLSLPSPANLQEVVAGTDLVATVPSRIALSYGEDVHVCVCPCAAPFEIDLIWTSRTHHSTKHKWLRDLIADKVVKEQIIGREAEITTD